MLARMNVEPVSLWSGLSDDMEGWLSAANDQFDNESRWAPQVDVIEEEDYYLFRADVPGVESKNIDVIFEDNALTIKGERSENKQSEVKRYKRIERSCGSFQRSFRLPDNIDADAISAKSAKGVLEVRVPKQEKAQKKIEIQE